MENYDSLFLPSEAAQDVPAPPFDKQAWAEKKKSERQLVYSLIDTTIASITKSNEMLTAALNVMARFDRYSTGNVLLITAQMPGATKLADFETWKKDGVYVQKGANHIKLLEPGDEFQRADGSRGVNYNVKHVFDISQTSAKSLHSKVQYDMRLLLKALLNNAPCPVEISEKIPDGVGAIYIPDAHKIHVRPGMNGTDIFQCLTQEISHAYLAQGKNYDRNSYAFIADCAAYVLCSRYNVDTQSFNFATSIGRMDTHDLRASLERARDCANQISLDVSKMLGQGSRYRDRELH